MVPGGGNLVLRFSKGKSEVNDYFCLPATHSNDTTYNEQTPFEANVEERQMLAKLIHGMTVQSFQIYWPVSSCFMGTGSFMLNVIFGIWIVL